MIEQTNISGGTRPIFVIGLNRSGTKWLSNELAKHPQIACV